jgi:hypothetical protein
MRADLSCTFNLYTIYKNLVSELRLVAKLPTYEIKKAHEPAFSAVFAL